eukprot:gene10072-10227_t
MLVHLWIPAVRVTVLSLRHLFCSEDPLNPAVVKDRPDVEADVRYRRVDYSAELVAEARLGFASCLAAGEAQIPLAKAALLIAAEDDAIAGFSCPPYGRSNLPPNKLIDHPGVWEDARLAYLNEVLVKKRGSPAALSILYCEVMRQLLLLGAVNFAVTFQLSSEALVELLRHLKRSYWPFPWDTNIDSPGAGGAGSLGGFRAAAKAALGSDQLSAALRAVSATAAHRLARGIWTSPGAGDLNRCLAAAERLVMMVGDEQPQERRDLAVLLLHAGQPAAAAAELAAYMDATKGSQLGIINPFDAKLVHELGRMMKDTGIKPNRSSVSGCLSLTPWTAFLSALLFVAGLALWISGSVKVNEYTLQVASAIDVNSSVTDTLRSGVLTAILATAITGVAISVLVIGLALVRTAQRSMLGGVCCCSNWDKPEPCLFTAYRFFSSVLTFVVWLLLLAIVTVMMVMLLWLGGAVAINTAITKGRTQADSVLAGTGLNLDSMSDASAAAMAFLNHFLKSPADAANLMRSPLASQLAFQPICPPVCLNLGSFAMFLQSSSCICGSDKLHIIQQAAREGQKVALIGLAGAFAMYLSSTLLLMVLTGHYVMARYDRTAARQRKKQAAEEYESGYLADPADCRMEFANDVNHSSKGASALAGNGYHVNAATMSSQYAQPHREYVGNFVRQQQQFGRGFDAPRV